MVIIGNSEVFSRNSGYWGLFCPYLEDFSVYVIHSIVKYGCGLGGNLDLCLGLGRGIPIIGCGANGHDYSFLLFLILSVLTR